MQLLPGQKADVTKGRSIREITVNMGWTAQHSNIEIDGAAFLISGAGKCERDEDFIFYGQPTSRGQAVSHSQENNSDKEQLKITLARVPSDIQKIAFTLTIHEGEKKGHFFNQVGGTFLRITNSDTNEEILRFEFGNDLQNETAIVAGELYLHNGEWKFNAVGRGFHGGLAALCGNFGIEVSNEPVQHEYEKEVKPSNSHFESSPKLQQVDPSKKVLPHTHDIQQQPLSFKKVELKKKESVSIKKSSKVTAVLKWDSKKDLDLYCFYVTKKGETGKIYYKNLGQSGKMPYITLDGDSKQAGSETIIIHKPDELNYVLFAAYSALSNGIGSFKSMKARVVVDNHEGQTVTSPLLEENKYAYWVAIAKIDFSSHGSMKVGHVETYSKSGSERSPLLYEDGSFQMDKGPIEFKTPSLFGSLFGGKKK